jgi:hypothetical protein
MEPFCTARYVCLPLCLINSGGTDRAKSHDDAVTVVRDQALPQHATEASERSHQDLSSRRSSLLYLYLMWVLHFISGAPLVIDIPFDQRYRWRTRSLRSSRRYEPFSITSALVLMLHQLQYRYLLSGCATFVAEFPSTQLILIYPLSARKVWCTVCWPPA